MKNVKRLLSVLLTAAMLLSLLPTFALANETEQIQWTDVSTAEQLTEIMTKGGNAKLTANITIAAVTVTKAVNVDFNGCTLTATGKITIKAGGNVIFSGDGIFTSSVTESFTLDGGDLTINSGTFSTITATHKIAYAKNTGSHMYVNGGTINAGYIQVNNGVLEIRNATVNATVFQPKVGGGGSAASIVRIYSGTISAIDYRHLSTGAQLHVYGGTIGNLVLNKNATTKPAQIHGGTFNGTLSIKAGNLIVDGGKFKNELGAAHIADGYFSFKGGDGYYTVHKEPDVPADGNTVTVATDAEFMWAVQSGYNIVLGQDITIDAYDTIKFTKPVTLELGDFTLTINAHHGENVLSAQYAEASESGMVINAGAGGIVVNSKVLAEENTKAFFRVNTMKNGDVLYPNKLTINGGTYTWNNASEQEDTAVFSTRVMFNLYTSHPESGTVLVNGATLISDFGVLYNTNKTESPVFTNTTFLDTAMEEAIDANDAVEHLWKAGEESFYGVAVYPGKTPMYRGGEPSKAADAEFTYAFAGWATTTDEEGNVTYEAEFSKTTNTYKVTWVIGDETIEETYAYGAMPQAPAISRDPDAENHYIAGWDSEIAAVTGDVTYTAIFTAEAHAEGEKADHKCDACGKTLSTCEEHWVADRVIPATYESNAIQVYVCSVCGAEKQEEIPDTKLEKPSAITLNQRSLLLEELIAVKYQFNVDGTYSQEYIETHGGLLVWMEADIADGKEYVKGTETYVLEGLTKNGSVYTATAKGVAAKQMGDKMYARGYIINEQGEYEYTEIIDFNPKIYAELILGRNEEVYTKLHPLMVAMLNYGAAAQTYFGHKTDALMNANLTAEQQALVSFNAGQIEGLEADTSKYQFAADITLGSLSHPLVLENNVWLKYKFQLNDAVVSNATEIKLVYWSETQYNAVDVLTVANASGTSALEVNGSYYTAVIEGIAAKNMGETYYACVYAKYADGSEHYSAVDVFSIHYYCNAIISGNYDAKLQDLCEWMVAYSAAAKAYFVK